MPTYPTLQTISSQPAHPISLSRPAYLTPTAIPTLQTNIIRISDQATFGGGLRYYRHRYSKGQPWNADGTKILLGLDSGTQYLLDGKTYAYLSTRTNMPEVSHWHNSNPDKLWGVNPSNVFGYYTPSANTFTTIHDYSGEFTYCHIGAGEGCPSNDDRYIPIVAGTGGNYTGIVYDTVNNNEAGRNAFAQQFDWMGMSQSGTYVVVQALAGGYGVYDRSFNLLRTINVTDTGHADLGYDSNGNEVIFYADNDGAGHFVLSTVRLDNAAVTAQDQSNAFLSSNFHLSCRNTSRPGYAYVSSCGVSYATVPTVYMYWEVYAIKLDGSGMMERYSQDWRHDNPDDDLYYQRSTMAVPNRDGSKVMWASDWQDGTTSALIYDYVVGVNLFDANAVLDDHFQMMVRWGT